MTSESTYIPFKRTTTLSQSDIEEFEELSIIASLRLPSQDLGRYDVPIKIRSNSSILDIEKEVSQQMQLEIEKAEEILRTRPKTIVENSNDRQHLNQFRSMLSSSEKVLPSPSIFSGYPLSSPSTSSVSSSSSQLSPIFGSSYLQKKQ